MAKKRNRFKIIYDILKAIHDKNNRILHTHILYKSNLSYDMLQLYLNELMHKNMVVEGTNYDKRVYGLTDKGFEYLRQYNTMVVNFGQVFGLEEEAKEW